MAIKVKNKGKLIKDRVNDAIGIIEREAKNGKFFETDFREAIDVVLSKYKLYRTNGEEFYVSLNTLVNKVRELDSVPVAP